MLILAASGYGCIVSPGNYEKTCIDIYFSDLELAGIKNIGTIASDVCIADAGGNPMPEYGGRLECIENCFDEDEKADVSLSDTSSNGVTKACNYGELINKSQKKTAPAISGTV